MRFIPSVPTVALVACLVGCGSEGESTAMSLLGPVLDGASLTPLSPTNQVALAGENVVAPEVLLLASDLSAVDGARIQFVARAGGVVAVSDAITDTNGRASAGAWQLGRLTGEYNVEARVLGLSESVTFRAEASSEYTIAVRFLAPFSASEREVVDRAVRRWSGVIINDLPLVHVSPADALAACGVVEIEAQVVDDVLVYMDRVAIDGAGGRVAQVGPCLIRDGNAPVVSLITLDSADFNARIPEDELDALVMHQLGHALGFGVLWPSLGLLTNASLPASPEADPQFVGDASRNELAILSAQSTTPGVPVQSGARFGESDIHWREDSLPGELMAPLEAQSNRGSALSTLTSSALDDLGFYVINPAAVDAYALAAGRPAMPTTFSLCEVRSESLSVIP